MYPLDSTAARPSSPLAAWRRALVATTVFAAALALSTVATTRLSGLLSGYALKAVPAVITFVVVTTVLVLVIRVGHRSSLSAVGVSAGWSALRSLSVGVAVTLSCALLVFGPATAAGWLRWHSVDWPTLTVFLLVNTILLFCLEAWPEELTFRGYALTALAGGTSRWMSLAGTWLLFVLVPAWSTVLASCAELLLTGRWTPPTWAPAGNEPVSYLLLMAVFGTALLIARTRGGSLWTSIGLHLAAITTQRIILARPESGVHVELASPDVLVLVPGYLALTALAFALLPRTVRSTNPVIEDRQRTARGQATG